MELTWKAPNCEDCKHRLEINYDKSMLKIDWWKCDARQQAIRNNVYTDRLSNCWYFEKG
jgi:hypothetical protein